MRSLVTFVAVAALSMVASGTGRAERSSAVEFAPLAAEMARPDWHAEPVCDFPIRAHVGRC